MTSMFFYTFNI